MHISLSNHKTPSLPFHRLIKIAAKQNDNGDNNAIKTAFCAHDSETFVSMFSFSFFFLSWIEGDHTDLISFFNAGMWLYFRIYKSPGDERIKVQDTMLWAKSKWIKKSHLFYTFDCQRPDLVRSMHTLTEWYRSEKNRNMPWKMKQGTKMF